MLGNASCNRNKEWTSREQTGLLGCSQSIFSLQWWPQWVGVIYRSLGAPPPRLHWTVFIHAWMVAAPQLPKMVRKHLLRFLNLYSLSPSPRLHAVRADCLGLGLTLGASPSVRVWQSTNLVVMILGKGHNQALEMASVCPLSEDSPVKHLLTCEVLSSRFWDQCISMKI